MMSGAGRRPVSADARLIPLASGSPMSSNTSSIGVPAAAASDAACMASRAVCATADGREAVQALQIRPVRLGDQRVVLDDQDGDRRVTEPPPAPSR